MKKTLVTFLVLSITALGVQASFSGVRADLENPTQGISITETWKFIATPPVLLGYESNSQDSAAYICKSLSDKICTDSVSISAASHLPPCSAQIPTDCISGVYSIDETGKRTEGKFVKYVPENSPTDFEASLTNNLPQGRGQGGIWQIPGVTHEGGNDNYYVSTLVMGRIDKTAGAQVTNQKFIINNLESAISPVIEKAGRYKQQFPSDSTNASRDGSKNGGIGSGNESQDDTTPCIVTISGYCELPQNFPANTRFGINVKLSHKIKGWFHGRIYRPQISAVSTNSGQDINIEALPVKVPTIREQLPTSSISDALRAYLSQDKQFSTGGNYLMPGSSGTDAFDQASLWLPLLKDKASTSNTYWDVRTLADYESGNDIRKCTNNEGGLAGVVTTNSLVYSAGPPTFNKAEQSLDYKLLSPHFNSDGTEAKGTYDLVLKSDVARCIYGFSKAPIQASIAIVSASGEAQVATQVIGEKEGWLYLSANNFSFSSPTIKVKLSQEAEKTPEASPSASTPTASKSTITCIKGKTTKKVTAVNPKCPNGYKKKA